MSLLNRQRAAHGAVVGWPHSPSKGVGDRHPKGALPQQARPAVPGGPRVFPRRRAHPAVPILDHAKESSGARRATVSFASLVRRGQSPPREMPRGGTRAGLHLPSLGRWSSGCFARANSLPFIYPDTKAWPPDRVQLFVSKLNFRRRSPGARAIINRRDSRPGAAGDLSIFESRLGVTRPGGAGRRPGRARRVKPRGVRVPRALRAACQLAEYLG